MTNEKEMVDAFEKLSEAGNGVLAIPPQNEAERKERDRLMQEYLLQRKSKEVAAPRE
ncbi:hypothetical protein [Paenibacillus cymbidii]|uniref:hypothetical protein n=1 Tax=Paenibacillus cymbidii TaxID=1639034 RepID=UPI00143688EC|nr:hypothetical protein [Paenibacillus cymbidii]